MTDRYIVVLEGEDVVDSWYFGPYRHEYTAIAAASHWSKTHPEEPAAVVMCLRPCGEFPTN
jgi:hypothetical protein